MLQTFEKLYRKLPNSYAKSILKNIISFTLHAYAHKVEKLTVHNEKIKLYNDVIFPNSILEKEVQGYNQKYSLQPGNVVIDAGAYTGLFSIYAAKKVGKKGRVIAYEPDPYNRIILRRNMMLNNVSNITVVPKGLYDKDTIIGFDIQGISSTIVDKKNNGIKTMNKIQVAKLDTEVKRLKLPKVDFVKMDIEGAEIEAVNGAKETIKSNSAIHFAIASYHMVKGKQTREYLEKFFKKLDMQVTTGYKTHLTTYASHK